MNPEDPRVSKLDNSRNSRDSRNSRNSRNSINASLERIASELAEEESSGEDYSGDEILALLRARVQRIKDDIKR